MLLGQEEATVSGGSFVKEEYKLVVVVEAAAAMRQSGWMWHDTKPIKTSILAKKIKQNISAEDICLIKMKTIPERAVALK
jgi:hypothetical protein